jgi:predicted enzyme related to lactoylglutathione lyase
VASEASDRRETAMGAPVVRFEVIGKDAGRLKNFYADLFAWEIERSPTRPGATD